MLSKIVFFVTACKKSGPIQQTLNIIKNLDREKFDPILLTIYEEATDGSSQLEKFLPYVKHYYIPTGKKEILLGTDKKLRKCLEEIQPDVIHTLGAFPNFAIARLKKFKQVITLRNYIFTDGFDKYGYLKSMLAAYMNMYAIKRAAKTVTCSASLADIYKEKLKLDFDYIQNGVDIENYHEPVPEEKERLRRELKLPEEKFVFVYSGQIIQRKNQVFLLEAFEKYLTASNIYLLILGDGNMLQELKTRFGSISGVDFRGNVLNVNDYLKACDAYVSTSISEGMPNGVLEAMATGLPYVLSDIEQHLEIYNTDPKCGFVYQQGNYQELAQNMQKLTESDYREMGTKAAITVRNNLSAEMNSQKYQQIYRSLSEGGNSRK